MADPWPGFLTAARLLGVSVSPAMLAQFRTYHELLRNWNRRVNLVSRKDTMRLVSYHFVDSLACVGQIPASARVLDLGSGAGLPGIPVAIVRPDLTVVLAESMRKRSIFLEEARHALGLDRVQVAPARAEALDAVFDVVLVRLVGEVAPVVRLIGGRVAAGGRLVFYKSGPVEAELGRAGPVVKRLGFAIRPTRDVLLPGLGVVRRFVVVERT